MDPVLLTKEYDTRSGDAPPVRERIIARGGLHKIGAQAPYFSLTGDLQERVPAPGGGWWRTHSFGALGDCIVKHAPELADLAAMHLSTIDGRPMHAADNGWYWLAGALGGAGEEYHGGNGTGPKSPAECLGIFARLMRVSIHEAAQLRDEFAAARAALGPYSRSWSRAGGDAMRKRMAEWCDKQGPRWAAEAAQCIARHNLKVYP